MMYDKEEIYDEKIEPLMAKIIKICNEEGINMVSSFYLNDEGLLCSTYLKGDKQSDTLSLIRDMIVSDMSSEEIKENIKLGKIRDAI